MKTKLQNGQKLTRQFRNARLSACDGVRAAQLDEESRIVKDVSVSSDEPYERWYGTEILLHEAKNVDLSRVKSGAAPLLYNHDRDAFAGKIMNPQLRDGKLYVDFKFSQNEQATQMLADLKDGLLTECSIGYDVNKFEVDEDEESYTATLWTLYEVSLVTVPADFTVGVGRADESDGKEVEILIREKSLNSEKKGIDTEPNPLQKRETAKIDTRTNTMTAEEQAAADEKARKQRERDEADAARERNEKIQEGIKAARARETEIRAIAKKSGKVPDKVLEKAIEDAVEDENAVEAFRKLVFEKYWGNAEDVVETPGNGNGDVTPTNGRGRALSIGAQFVKSEQFQQASKRRGQGERTASLDVDISVLGIRGKVAMAQRAGFTSSDLAPVNVQIQTGVIGLGVQRLTIMDLIAPGATSAAAIIYPQENSFGTIDGVAPAAGSGGETGMPRAKTVGERGLKPLWEPDLTTVTANVRKVAITTKVPDEFMADFPAAQSFIDERLPFMVDTETEYQILYGDGLGNNLKGIFTFANVQTRAITTTDDSTKAASLLQGLTDIRVGSFFEPDGYAFHPYDWETAKLLKDSTGRFLAGGPYYIPYTNGVFMELNTFWGKPVVVSTAVTYRRPLAGCWKLGAQYFMREGMRLEMTNANEDDFRRNLIMLRAEHRLALAVYRPLAFMEFTGFPART